MTSCASRPPDRRILERRKTRPAARYLPRSATASSKVSTSRGLMRRPMSASSAGAARPRALGGPEHVSEHAGGRRTTVHVRHHVTHEARRQRLQRLREVGAFGDHLAADEIHRSCEPGWCQRRNRRRVLRLAIHVLLPVRDRIPHARLPRRHHRIRIVEQGRGASQPLRGRLARDGDQPAITGRQIDDESRRVFDSARVIRRHRWATAAALSPNCVAFCASASFQALV